MGECSYPSCREHAVHEVVIEPAPGDGYRTLCPYHHENYTRSGLLDVTEAGF